MERLSRALAWLLPANVVYWAFIRFWANATCTDEGRKMHPDEMTWTKAIELWERKHGAA